MLGAIGRGFRLTRAPVLADLRHRAAHRGHRAGRGLDAGHADLPARPGHPDGLGVRARRGAGPGPHQRAHLRRLGGLRGPVHHHGRLAAVPRPADAQGGLRRRADDPGRDHHRRDPRRPAAVRPAPGPVRGRGAVVAAARAAAARSTTSRTSSSRLTHLAPAPGRRAASTPPPTPRRCPTFAAMVVFLLLVGGLGLAAVPGPRAPPGRRAAARTGARRRDGDRRPSCARRAEAALAEGRHADALVDGFRALAVRQVERGRLDDLPGATAHEVADALGDGVPRAAAAGRRQRRASSTRCCTATARPPREQAAGVLALDDELAARR